LDCFSFRIYKAVFLGSRLWSSFFPPIQPFSLAGQVFYLALALGFCVLKDPFLFFFLVEHFWAGAFKNLSVLEASFFLRSRKTCENIPSLL